MFSSWHKGTSISFSPTGVATPVLLSCCPSFGPLYSLPLPHQVHPTNAARVVFLIPNLTIILSLNFLWFCLACLVKSNTFQYVQLTTLAPTLVTQAYLCFPPLLLSMGLLTFFFKCEVSQFPPLHLSCSAYLKYQLLHVVCLWNTTQPPVSSSNAISSMVLLHIRRIQGRERSLWAIAILFTPS